MKKETLEKFLNTLKKTLDSNREKEKALEKVFGGDTTIMTEDVGIFADEFLTIIAEDFINPLSTNEVKETLDWYFWEVYYNSSDIVASAKEFSFEMNGKIYESNIDNIYKLLKDEI